MNAGAAEVVGKVLGCPVARSRCEIQSTSSIPRSCSSRPVSPTGGQDPAPECRRARWPGHAASASEAPGHHGHRQPGLRRSRLAAAWAGASGPRREAGGPPETPSGPGCDPGLAPGLAVPALAAEGPETLAAGGTTIDHLPRARKTHGTRKDVIEAKDEIRPKVVMRVMRPRWSTRRRRASRTAVEETEGSEGEMKLGKVNPTGFRSGS